MLFKLESGIVININQITAIETRAPKEFKCDDGRIIKLEFIIHMTDKYQWYATINDYNVLIK